MNQRLQRLIRRYLRWRYKIPAYPPGRLVTYIGQPATIVGYRLRHIQLQLHSSHLVIDATPGYRINWLPLGCRHCGQDPFGLLTVPAQGETPWAATSSTTTRHASSPTPPTPGATPTSSTFH